jgi:uncharacterized protein involved in exopolysaccharide biosynthesis
MNEDELVQEKVITLWDLWGKLRAGWRYVAGGTALGLLAAGLAIGVMAPKYIAVALVQVGQVGQVGESSSVPAEPVTQAIERLKTRAFQMNVAQHLGLQNWLDELLGPVGATSAFMTVQVDKTTAAAPMPLIELKVTASSAESARKVVDAVLVGLAKKHAEILEPTVNRLKDDLALAKERRQQAETDLATLEKIADAAAIRDDRFTQLALMTSLSLQKRLELFQQRQLIAQLDTALAFPATQQVRLLDGAFVSDKPVSPKKGLLFALGFGGGLLVGVAAAFVADSWRRRR